VAGLEHRQLVGELGLLAPDLGGVVPGGADLDEGVGMGLLALLLDSKTSKRGNINWCVSIFYPPAPKKLSGPLWGVPVEMLLEGKLARKVSDQFWFLRSP
jgi:hypothetical protein